MRIIVTGIMTVVRVLLTINFVRVEGFRPNLNSGEGAILLYLELELVAQQGP